MSRITVEYDANNRTFKLLHGELGAVLEDGHLYELELPSMFDGLSDEEKLELIGTPVAHA